MLKTYLYIPENLAAKILFTAKSQNKRKAEVIRTALQEGLEVLEKKKAGGAEVLVNIATLAEKYNIKGPKDGSVNHDYYLWGLPKKNTKIKP